MKCHSCVARQLQALRSWLIQSSTAGKIRETQLTASSSACIPRVRHYLLLFLVSCLEITTLSGCGSPPQVLTDEAVFGELDALYTAVTSKRRNLLEDCQKRINKLHDEQRMSDEGFNEVEAIIALAEQDKWTPAAERLYAFMRGQRKAE